MVSFGLFSVYLHIGKQKHCFKIEELKHAMSPWKKGKEKGREHKSNSFIHSFIHSFKKYLSWGHCKPGAELALASRSAQPGIEVDSYQDIVGA